MTNFYEVVGWEDIMSNNEIDKRETFYEVEMYKMMDRLDEEIIAGIGQHWLTLKAQDETWVARHTLIVMALVVTDPIFPELTAEEQNILKWAALLHDLGKVQQPTIRGRDHVHPIMSGINTIDIFEKLGFIENLDEEKR